MKYQRLGRTGISASRLSLGAMMLGAWGTSDEDECRQLVHTALDAGINLIDTADYYSAGQSEEILGRVLGSRRDDVILATKAFFPMGEDPNRRGGSRRWLTMAVEDSLTRLQTDRIDVYQLHRPDPQTPIEETLAALTDLQQAGKIVNFGTSTFPATQLVTAAWTAERHGLRRLATEQAPYSILGREVERDVLPTTADLDMGVLTYAPLAGGWLSGRYTQATADPGHRIDRLPDRFDLAHPQNQAKLACVRELAQVAADAGISLIHLSIAFALDHPAVTSVLLGPRTTQQLVDQLGAVDVHLDADIRARIDEIVAPGETVDRRFDLHYAWPHLEHRTTEGPA